MESGFFGVFHLFLFYFIFWMPLFSLQNTGTPPFFLTVDIIYFDFLDKKTLGDNVSI